MKPFTLLLIILGLVLGFYLLAGSHTAVLFPPEPVPAPYAILTAARTTPAPRDAESDELESDDEDRREVVEGVPVPIVPGTRVDEARILPPDAGVARPVAPPFAGSTRARVPARPALNAPSTARRISGRLSATVERARDDARLQLEREVTEWLMPEVPAQWKPPAHLITRMIRETEVHPIVKEYGTVYEATLESDFSPPHRDEILGAYQRQVVGERLGILGAIIGFVLACLAALAGYIRADEATKGYYTGWLRVVAAAGVGASGMAIYHVLM